MRLRYGRVHMNYLPMFRGAGSLVFSMQTMPNEILNYPKRRGWKALCAFSVQVFIDVKKSRNINLCQFRPVSFEARKRWLKRFFDVKDSAVVKGSWRLSFRAVGQCLNEFEWTYNSSQPRSKAHQTSSNNISPLCTENLVSQCTVMSLRHLIFFFPLNAVLSHWRNSFWDTTLHSIIDVHFSLFCCIGVRPRVGMGRPFQLPFWSTCI